MDTRYQSSVELAQLRDLSQQLLMGGRRRRRIGHEGSIKILPLSGAVVLNIDVEDHFKLIEVRREVERILIGRSARLADAGVRKAFSELRDRFNKAAQANDETIFMSADQEFNAWWRAARTMSTPPTPWARCRHRPGGPGSSTSRSPVTWRRCRLHAGIAESIAAKRRGCRQEGIRPADRLRRGIHVPDDARLRGAPDHRR